MTKIRLTFITVALATSLAASAATDSVAAPDTTARRLNLIQKVIKYFDDSNKPRSDKAFDISFIGGPHYSSDTKFGIGLVASGLYHTDRADTLLPPSNVSIKADATTSGYFSLGLTGVNIWPHDRMRLNYSSDFYYVKTYSWGFGYDECSDNANKTPYRYFRATVRADLQWRFGRIYLGPEAGLDYNRGFIVQRADLWHGQSDRTFNFGLGLKATYDTRDNLTNTHRGVLVSLTQRFYPRFLGNGEYHFNLTELTAASFHPLWKGATLADRLHTRLTYGNTPWGMMSTLGGSDVMRGYYEGRYRDKSEIDLTLELRQHVWRRNGLVVWGGVASIFSKFSQIRFNQLLPNFGIGYRWEFKRDVNVRIDLGFGRGEFGFILNINEAF